MTPPIPWYTLRVEKEDNIMTDNLYTWNGSDIKNVSFRSCKDGFILKITRELSNFYSYDSSYIVSFSGDKDRGVTFTEIVNNENREPQVFLVTKRDVFYYFFNGDVPGITYYQFYNKQGVRLKGLPEFIDPYLIEYAFNVIGG